MRLAGALSLFATAAMIATPVSVAAQDGAQVFKPAGQWALDYGSDYCRLARTFSNGQEDLSLAIERIQPGPFARLILVSDAVRPFRSADQIGWHFTPTDPERKAMFTRSETADGKSYFNLGPFTLAPFVPPTPGTPPAPPPPYDRDQEQATAKAFTGFVLGSGLNTPVRVETGPLDAPVAALQACADDLASTWGLDPAALKTQKAPALPEGGGVGWLPTGTIAFTDFARLAGGSNQVRLMVDAAGKPTACHIHWPTLDQATNDKICKALMANATFTPAQDATGQPMAGFWIGNPTFLGPPPPGGAGGG